MLHYSTKIVCCQYVSYIHMRQQHMGVLATSTHDDIHKLNDSYVKLKLD
ncbi:hypothetical protein CPter291_4017 [Collimonas pratensis]|uniref:Uncharacterized protein n=1 Tax=Collimonas pratensis TaxID=279113 RepID=A0ABM5ZAX6_9BURK|nr:hypothetical protein CPter291_4017 [Collimonas pratensis]